MYAHTHPTHKLFTTRKYKMKKNEKESKYLHGRKDPEVIETS